MIGYIKNNIYMILKRIMYKRLYEYLTKNNMLFDKHFGFRKGHSTKHALVELVNRIYYFFNENKYTLGTFIEPSSQKTRTLWNRKQQFKVVYKLSLTNKAIHRT